MRRPRVESGYRTIFNLSWILLAAVFPSCQMMVSLYDLLVDKNSAAATYAVAYNGNGHTGGSVPVDSNKYRKGARVSVQGNVGSLARTGHFFTVWNSASNGSGTAFASGTMFAIGAADITLYAQWAAGLSVVYYGNGNTTGTVPIDPNSYLTGSTVTVLGNTGTLTRSGYAFSGWNTAANGSGTDYSAGNTFSMGASLVNLYAKWVDNLTPVVTVSTIASSNANSQWARIGDVVTLNFTSTDGTNIVSETVMINGQTATVSGSAGNYAAHYSVGAGDTNGVVSYSVFVTNVSAISSMTVTSGAAGSVTVDTIAPALVISSFTDLGIEVNTMGSTAFSVGDWLTLTFNITETPSTLQVVMDGSSVTATGLGSGPYTAQYTVAPGDPSQGFQIDVVDTAGNLHTATYVYSGSWQVTYPN